MAALQGFARIVTAINHWIGRWAAYLVIPIFLMLMAEVFLRYFAGKPVVWTNELSQMLFGVSAVLSGGYLMAHSGHANVDILSARLAPRARAAVDIFTSILFFLFVGALLYYGAALAFESVQRLEHSQSAWNPPIWPVKLCIPIGALLLLLQGIVKLIDDILVASGHKGLLPDVVEKDVADTGHGDTL